MSQPTSQSRTAEVVSIGDEMTTGARLDTNAQWLSQRLGELGIRVSYHSTVGDTLQDNIDVFRIAAGRADFVVSTGGLGPTRDDLTREALAAAAGTNLELRPDALSHIESIFARRRRTMPERNRLQAMFPALSEVIFNPQGTAPGVELALATAGDQPAWVFALPGVPAEMMRMFDDSVAPRILQLSGGATRIGHLVMKFFGIGESDMEERLGEMIARDRQPRVGITVSAATISLRITAMADSDQSCDAMIAHTREEILQLVGDLYFGDGERFEQQHAIDATLRQRGESMMLIELGRAAPLGDWFAALGQTPAFRGGLSLADLSDLQQVSRGADPQQTDEQLDAILNSVRRQFSADWLLLVDAYPALDSLDGGPIPAADVNLRVVCPNGKQMATKVTLGGHPEILQPRIAKSAMSWMRKVINSSRAGSTRSGLDRLS